MRFYLPLLAVLLFLQSCDAFTDKRAVTKEEFYELKDNVTITKISEGKILEEATPKAQEIYQKIEAKKNEVISFLENTPAKQQELFNLLELDSTQAELVEKIAYRKNIAENEYDKEKQIFEAYQSVTDPSLYQENLQILHGKEKILYSYPNFDTENQKLGGVWSIILSQKKVIRSFKKEKKSRFK